MKERCIRVEVCGNETLLLFICLPTTANMHAQAHDFSASQTLSCEQLSFPCMSFLQSSSSQKGSADPPKQRRSKAQSLQLHTTPFSLSSTRGHQSSSPSTIGTHRSNLSNKRHRPRNKRRRSFPCSLLHTFTPPPGFCKTQVLRTRRAVQIRVRT